MTNDDKGERVVRKSHFCGDVIFERPPTYLFCLLYVMATLINLKETVHFDQNNKKQFKIITTTKTLIKRMIRGELMTHRSTCTAVQLSPAVIGWERGEEVAGNGVPLVAMMC